MAAYSPPWFVARVGQSVAYESGRGDPRLTSQLRRSVIELWCGSSAPLASDDLTGVTVLLHGNLFGAVADAGLVLDSFLADGDAALMSLNGSFALVIFDPPGDRVIVVTDRFGSRKVFACEGEGGWWLSSSLLRQPTSGYSLSPAGVGSLLSSGAAQADLTPFAGVRKLSPGSIHSFSDAGASTVQYWGYTNRQDLAVRPVDDVRTQLIDLMRDAVRRRLRSSGEVYLALSGGGDSRTVAGLLAEIIDAGRVRAFTYHYGKPVGDTDVRVAGEVAARLGFRHEVVVAYRGDLMRVIAANSASGQGLANFCQEADVWTELGPVLASSSDNVLFVAEVVGRANMPKGGTAEAALASGADINPIASIDYFLDGLDPDVAGVISEGWDTYYGELREGLVDCVDPRAAYEDVRLSQRLPNTLMPWREFYLTPYVRVANPLLDDHVVDLTLSVPVELRMNKALYRQALAEAFPNLAGIPIAKGGWNAPDWAAELRANAGVIREILQEPSRLDELIPAGAIARLLDSGLSAGPVRRDNLTTRMKTMAKHSAAIRHAVRAAKPRVQPPVRRRRPWDRLLLDLLSLRGFLSK